MPAVSISSACTNTSKLDTSSMSILPFTRTEEPSISAVKAPLDIPLILSATVPSRFSTFRFIPSLVRNATRPLFMVMSPSKLPDLFGSDGFTNFSTLQDPSTNCHIWRSGASTVTLDIAVAPDVLPPIMLGNVDSLTPTATSCAVPTKCPSRSLITTSDRTTSPFQLIRRES